MNIHHIEQFLVIKKYKHMAVAADILNTSQPALSRNLAALEGELGVQLFDRVGCRIVLNQNGETFAAYAEQALKLLNMAQFSMKDMKYLTGGHINIVSYVYSGIVTEWICQYRKFNPMVSFSVAKGETHVGEDTDELPDFVLKAVGGAYDAASHTPYWVPKILFREQSYLVTSPDYRPIDWDALEGDMDLSLLKDVCFITVEHKNLFYYDRTYEFCKRAGFVPHVCCQAEDFMSKMKCVRENMGVTLIPESCLEDARHLVEGLRVIPLKNVSDRTLVLLRPRKSLMNETAADFYQFVLDFYHLSDQEAE